LVDWYVGGAGSLRRGRGCGRRCRNRRDLSGHRDRIQGNVQIHIGGIDPPSAALGRDHGQPVTGGGLGRDLQFISLVQHPHDAVDRSRPSSQTKATGGHHAAGLGEGRGSQGRSRGVCGNGRCGRGRRRRWRICNSEGTSGSPIGCCCGQRLGDGRGHVAGIKGRLGHGRTSTTTGCKQRREANEASSNDQTSTILHHNVSLPKIGYAALSQHLLIHLERGRGHLRLGVVRQHPLPAALRQFGPQLGIA